MKPPTLVHRARQADEGCYHYQVVITWMGDCL